MGQKRKKKSKILWCDEGPIGTCGYIYMCVTENPEPPDDWPDDEEGLTYAMPPDWPVKEDE